MGITFSASLQYSGGRVLKPSRNRHLSPQV
jgi:hypothetical protein